MGEKGSVLLVCMGEKGSVLMGWRCMGENVHKTKPRVGSAKAKGDCQEGGEIGYDVERPYA